MNAQQYHLTGRVLIFPGMLNVDVTCNKHPVHVMFLSLGMNLVIVEGGPKGLKKYKHLMLYRIKWNQTRKKGAAAVVDGGCDKFSSK